MIALDHISRVFQVGDQTVHALRDIVLQIQQGEYVAITGPSGSGKSSLLHIIGLLDRASGGHYEFDGKDVTLLDDLALSSFRQQKIGFVFQFFHLVPRLTAAENIELPMMLAGIPARERKQRVDDALRNFVLRDRARHRPDELSGGQRQRVAIARATIMQPAVILADEPTGNLDQSTGKEIIEVLEGLNARGITLVIVTHDPEISKRTRRQIRLVDGAVISDALQTAGA